MGLPITCADIINLPMDEFNDLLSKHELTEEQLTLCRDIRRRGKNKVAAQNCRKRKIDQIKQLETEVTRIKCRKTELVTDHEKLMSQRSHWSDLVKRLHDFVLKVGGLLVIKDIIIFPIQEDLFLLRKYNWINLKSFLEKSLFIYIIISNV